MRVQSRVPPPRGVSNAICRRCLYKTCIYIKYKVSNTHDSNYRLTRVLGCLVHPHTTPLTTSFAYLSCASFCPHIQQASLAGSWQGQGGGVGVNLAIGVVKILRIVCNQNLDLTQHFMLNRISFSSVGPVIGIAD